jgi:Protein of unknown function (DUF3054)
VRQLPAFVVDVLFVLLFAFLGRVSHVEGVTLAGVLETAWPFLAGLVLGWVVVRAVRHRWPAEVLDAVPVWLLTTALGLLLRVLSGTGGAPLSFVAVATVVLAAFLLGWRSLAALTLFAIGGLARWSDGQARARSRR